MLPTPSTDHVSFERVYEPAEDSFLFLDALSSESEIAFLKDRFGPGRGRPKELRRDDDDDGDEAQSSGASLALSPSPVVLEVGVGSGVVLAFVTAHADVLFGRPDIVSVGSDVNRFACAAARQTVLTAVDEERRARTREDAPAATSMRRQTCRQYPTLFQGIMQADLAAPLRTGSVDVLLFNPPYVPTSELPPLPHSNTSSHLGDNDTAEELFQRDSHLLSLSYAGGSDGMVVTSRLLDQLPDLLSRPLGVAYILLCAQNKPDRVKQRVRGWGGDWMVDTVRTSGTRAGWERLQIIKIWRDSDAALCPRDTDLKL
ncbi:MAG: S-adenosylmethionine-dependent methyltransferase [Lichina confinis]|nr:MAG: S-adenosylmethionine-dependent methyltransferase [Lichina confinis]